MMREPELKPKMPQKRPLDILFVEDNTADVDLSLREFKKAELEVHADVVQTAQEFVERLSAKAYDVVLADYRLPGWTGMDALELLRQQGKEIPFILVTGALGEEMAVECIKRGVADYILKDRLVRLPVAICRVLEEKYLRDARLWAETVLQESKARFRTLTETIASAIFIHQGTECRYVNRAAEAITGYSREELLAMSSWDLVHPDSRKLVMEQGLARLRGEQTPGRFEIKVLTKQGEARWLDVTVAMIEYSGRPAGLTTAFDITERKRAEDEVRHLVASDPLTGLANYRRLLEVFDAEAKRSKRTGRPFALLLLDLDGLKKINDAQGHLVGSRALCIVDLLQSVQVQQQESERSSGALGPLRLRVEHFEKPAVIGETRQRITGHQMPNLVFRPFALSDVEGCSQPGRTAIVLNHCHRDVKPARLTLLCEDLDFKSPRGLFSP